MNSATAQADRRPGKRLFQARPAASGPAPGSNILGYRKGEQGRNAPELPKFEALAQGRDAEIAKLEAPMPVTYSLVPTGK